MRHHAASGLQQLVLSFPARLMGSPRVRGQADYNSASAVHCNSKASLLLLLFRVCFGAWGNMNELFYPPGWNADDPSLFPVFSWRVSAYKSLAAVSRRGAAAASAAVYLPLCQLMLLPLTTCPIIYAVPCLLSAQLDDAKGHGGALHCHQR